MDRMFECRGAHGCARATVPVKESRNQMSVYAGRVKRSVPVGEGALAGMLTPDRRYPFIQSIFLLLPTPYSHGGVISSI